MNDLLFILGGALTVGVIALVLAAIDFFVKCNHEWGDWSYKEDSACFMQKRQCIKCRYTEFQQIRKITNAPEQV